MITLILIIAGIITLIIGIIGTCSEILESEPYPMWWIFIIIGLIVAVAGMTCDNLDKQDKQETIDKYCEKAVEKGQFTSLEECKYVLEEY